MGQIVSCGYSRGAVGGERRTACGLPPLLPRQLAAVARAQGFDGSHDSRMGAAV